MTILHAITQADERRHNGCSLEDKLLWLSALDGRVHKLLLGEYGQVKEFSPYDLSTPMNTQLLIGHPFEEMYLYWLEANICYADGETADYNAAISQYNRLYEAFANAYRKSHVHVMSGRRFVF